MAQVMDTYTRSSPALNLMSDVYVQVRDRGRKREMEREKWKFKSKEAAD